MNPDPALRHPRGLVAQLAAVHVRLDDSPLLRPVEPAEGAILSRYLIAAAAKPPLVGRRKDAAAVEATPAQYLCACLAPSGSTSSMRLRSYWITNGRSRSGIVTLDNYPDGEACLTVHHLYLRPSVDNARLAMAVLRDVQEAAGAEGMSVRF